VLPEIPEGAVWTILLLPVASLLIIAFGTRPYPKLSGYVTIAAIGTALLLSLWSRPAVLVARVVVGLDGQPHPAADRRT
jgi:NADH:ubiquinone oxidoreductase subunit 5 (subunit L)/multisubunit Na+/H+ antiporter MnhA subunit